MDPNCAVGILEAFHAKHPDFGLKATFFVLPGAKQPHKLFGQPEYERQKLQHLAQRGFEIGNHTLWHADLRKFEHEIQKQLAMPVKIIQEAVPNYPVRALALPFGVYPKDLNSAVRGRLNGVASLLDGLIALAANVAISDRNSFKLNLVS